MCIYYTYKKYRYTNLQLDVSESCKKVVSDSCRKLASKVLHKIMAHWASNSVLYKIERKMSMRMYPRGSL